MKARVTKAGPWPRSFSSADREHRPDDRARAGAIIARHGDRRQRRSTGEPRAFFEAGELAFGERLRDEDRRPLGRDLRARSRHRGIRRRPRRRHRRDLQLRAHRAGRRAAGRRRHDRRRPPDASAPGHPAPDDAPAARRHPRRAASRSRSCGRREGEHLPALRLRPGSLHAVIKIDRATAAPSGSRTCRRARSASSTSTRRSASSRRSTTRSVRAARLLRAHARPTGTREVFPDPEHWRRGARPAFHVVHEVGGTPDGYVRYRIRDEWDAPGRSRRSIVVEMMASNPAAHLDLWRFVLDIDLMARIEAWNVAVDDPILLASPSRDAWGIDARRRALAAGRRRARRPCRAPLPHRRARVVLEVADEFCPWNDGRWALDVEAGVPARPADHRLAPDLACDVTDLARRLPRRLQLRAAGGGRRACAELRPGGVARADALFRTDRAPWCPRVF